jgi:hypothetical protein
MALTFLNSAPTGRTLSSTRNGRSMPGCASKEVWHLSFKIYRDLILVLGDIQTTQKDRSKTIKTPIAIHTKSNGCPKIPAITSADGYKTKVVQAMLRDYCTTHIRESSCDHLQLCVT